VSKSWKEKIISGYGWKTLNGKLVHCRHSLKKWVRKTANKTEENIRQRTKDLENIQMGSQGHNSEIEAEVSNELHLLLEQEDLKWRQRARKLATIW
jgi:hypothetical protein